MTNSGFDGTVNESQYARMWELGGVDAVEDSTAWQVVQGTGRQVSVDGNKSAFAKGIISYSAGTLTASLTTPTNGQWFLIVRRIDWSNNSVSLAAIPHSTTTTTTPGAAPTTYPAYNDDPGALYDHFLAWAWVNSVNTTVTIFDLRKLPLVERESGRLIQSRLPGGSPFATAVGSFTTNALASTATQTVSITYPAGRFTAAPGLFIETGDGRATTTIIANTATGATITLGNFTSGAMPQARVGAWFAVQMSAGSVSG